MNALLTHLAALTIAHPHERKLFLVPDVNYGRELLLTLARETGGWVGWEPVTLRRMAEEIAFVPLGELGRRVADDVELTTLSGAAIDHLVAAGIGSVGFRERATGLGFRGAVRDAMLELRVSGAGDAVRGVVTAGSAASDALAVMAEYERRLVAAGLVDPAGLFRLALDSFDEECAFVLDGPIFVSPNLVVSGLPGELLARLVERGATILAGDRPGGIARPARSVTNVFGPQTPEIPCERLTILGWSAAPDRLTSGADPAVPDAELVGLDFFNAANPSAELREVLRRVVGEGLGWDDVEIVTTDPDSYGIELDGLCARLGVPASLLHGVPLARTRIGRAVARYLEWLESGLPAAQLRAAVEAGEIEVPADASPMPDTAWRPAIAVARTLRRLGIGWGRERYEAALRSLTDGTYVAGVRRGEDEDPEAEGNRREARGREAGPLARLLAHLLRITPAVPELGNITPVRSSMPRLATATLGYLELVRPRGHAEEATMGRLRARLERLAESDEPARGFGSAMAALREALADLRAWSDVSEQNKPWAASGGAVHLTDIAHAGTSGRPRIFVVGLDADRAGGARLQDPIFVDAVRHAAAHSGLPPSAVRADEHRWRMLTMLATLRGHVTLSYSVSGSDGRDAAPCGALLGAYRAHVRNASVSYDDFVRALGTPACAVPDAAASALDARDVWLASLTDGALLLDGADVVRDGFPRTGYGLAAREALEGEILCDHHGLVPAAAGLFNPTKNAERPLSPSSLEQLARCPRAWFYNYALKLRPQDEAAYDPERWLDAMQRGSLLHDVYEQFGREFAGRQEQIVEDAARVRMREIVDGIIARVKADVPPPSMTVFEAECVELRQSADAFLQMERDALLHDPGRWESFETEFGFGEPAYLAVGDGEQFAVRGRIDRVDRMPDDSLRIVDYKTGSVARFRRNPKDAPYKGGRQLQPAVYLLAASQQLGAPVTQFEYRFPTVRGENAIVPLTAAESRGAVGVIASLLEHLDEGTFVATTDDSDCRYCDYATICRVRNVGTSTFVKIESPLATWAAARGPDHPQYAGMHARRGVTK